MKKTNKHEESDLQQVCVKWFRIKHPKIKIISSVNGVKLSGPKLQRIIKWKQLEREGAEAGVADLQVLKQNKTKAGLFIEMKTLEGTQKEKQKAFQKYCEENNYQYSIARTFDQFYQVVTDYLNS